MRTTSTLGVLLALGLTGPVFAQDRDHRPGDAKKDDKKPGASASGSATLDVNVGMNVNLGGGSQKPPPKPPATATGFTPRTGVVGTAVTISGTGFDKTTRIHIGGRALPRLISLTPTAITFAFPPKFGDGTIEVRHPKQPPINLGVFAADVAPSIFKFRPLFGPVGTRVEVEGKAFAAADLLNLGAVSAQIVERSDKRLVVVIPPGATTGKFSVFRGGAPVAVARQTFTVVLPSPTITSFTPTSGPPGTVVKVTGANFAADDRVYLGGLLMPVQTRGAGFVDVVVPLNAKLSAPISVRTVHGTGVSAQPFTVVLPPSVFRFAPQFGAPGTQVQLLGRAFLPTDEVKLGDKGPLKIVNRSEVVLTVEVPAGAPSAPFNVTRGGVVVASTKGPFTVTVAPVIAAFTPEAGPPGVKVTITGTGFTPDTKVLYGQQEVRVTARGGEAQLFVNVPANATTQPWVVSNRGGTATSAKPFTVQTPSSIDLVAPLFGPVGSKLTITGRNMDASDKYYLGNTLLPVVERAPGTAVVQIPAGAVSGPILWESWGRKNTSRFKFDVRQPLAYGSHSPGVMPAKYPITIAGANFSPTTQVFWGTQQLRVTSRKLPTGLVVEGPSGTPGINPLVIRDGAAEVKSTSPVELLDLPIIKAIAPATVSVGTQVTISGLNFNATYKVTHNNVELPYVSVTPTQAYVTIPAAASGSYPIVMDARGWPQKSSANLIVNNMTPPPPVPPTPTPPTPTPPVPPAPVPADPNHAAHEHPHQHPHAAGDHHHHPHGHPHKPGSTHHHPY